MKTVCTAWVLVVALLIANSAGAAGKKKDGGKKESGIAYFQTIDHRLKPVTLTEDQKSKLDALKKEYEPKLKDAYAKQNVLTPDQKKAGEEAKKAAKAAGKKGKDMGIAVTEAVKKTDDQKKQEKEARKQLGSLEKELRDKVSGLLTPDQKAQIDAAKPKKGDKPAKVKKSDKPAKDAKPVEPAKDAAAK